MAEMNTTKRRPMRHGPMGHGGGNMPGEKAKDFGGTMKKIFRYMRRYIPAMLLAVALAAAAVLCMLNIPNILGDATDKVILGVTKMSVYDQLSVVQEQLGTEFETVQELADALASQPGGEEITQKLDQVSDAYRQEILSTSLAQRPSVDLDAVLSIAVNLMILIGISTVLNYLQGFIMSGIAQKVSYRFRRDIEQKINKLPFSFYDKTTYGEVLSFLTNDVDTISTTLNQSLSQMVTSCVLLVGVVVMMLRISGWMTLVALAILPVAFLAINLIIKRSQKYFKGQQEYLGHVNGHIEEMYGGHDVVSLYNGEEKSIRTFKHLNTELYRSAWKSQFFSGLMMPLMNFMGNVGYVGVCVAGGYLAVTGNISVGNIQAFMQYIRQFNQPLSQMASIANTLQSTAAAAERVFDFLEQPEETETGTQQAENIRGRVDFEHVKFGYTPDHIVIQDFSIGVKPGQRVAIVGPTGAGKTTLVKLLMRFYNLNGGSILLDERDIADYTRDSLRAGFGMVLQETWLFSGTIRENIRYGRLSATDEEVYEAAKMAYADRFIRTLPGGYDFVINEEQANISQGQKQLLTIARAILANPSVLILDEATSSIDTRTELLIQRAMDKMMQGRTSFIIAHRLSTIRDADIILVLKDGDIVETGNHEALMAKNGFYAALYNSQFEGKAV